MSKRNYNVFFHTHTVSGIVISVALYIIFFAGAFALIKDEITAWEKGNTIETLAPKDINFDKLIKNIEAEGHALYGRDIRIIPPDAKKEIYVQLTDSQDTTIVNVPNKPTYFYADQESYKISEYYSFYSVGELLYRLHFFSSTTNNRYLHSRFCSILFFVCHCNRCNCTLEKNGF